jgi:hypothetical protein
MAEKPVSKIKGTADALLQFLLPAVYEFRAGAA